MTIKKIFIYILLGLTNSIFSQNLDSLYNSFMMQFSSTSNSVHVELESETPVKCGFGLAAEVKTHFNDFNYDQQQSIEKILARPDLPKSIVSPSGFFRIHYDTTSYNAPAYDINELAIAFDSAYTYEVKILGYPEPPSDGISGGDDKYDVYVTDLSRNYGYTEPETSFDDSKYISYIVVDNDYGSGFYTHGIDGGRVTAAHEFHHAIQIGNYGLRNDSDIYYYEITSTSMEEFVYNSINDYYNYMKSYFYYPYRRFTSYRSNSLDGYDLAVWNIFLKQKFGTETPNNGDKIIKRSWELMGEKNYRAIIALQSALNQYGFSFFDAFKEFGVWCYFTGKRAKENKYFSEAANYPLANTTLSSSLDPTKMPIMIDSEPTSLNYILILDYTQGTVDSIIAEFSNSDVDGTLSDGTDFNLDFSIDTNPFTDATAISQNYFAKIEGEKSNLIGSSYIINNELASDISSVNTVDYCYPQPFQYGLYQSISIPTYSDLSGNADLYIYSSDMNLVYNGAKSISVSGKSVVTWDGLSNKGDKLGSGVYIFVTKAGSKIKKGKLVILN